MNRRQFIISASVLAAGSSLPVLAAKESAVIYLSPIKSNGELSRCQAEVWYVQDGRDMVVVTAHDAWRARALERGLAETQVWVGDVGLWQRSGGKYKSLPSVRARGSMIDDDNAHARLLKKFGSKYYTEWGTWGPRFKEGLEEGSRVMLRYSPV